MNLQSSAPLETLKVLVTNPLSPAAQLIVIKILTGKLFGTNQLIDIILLVYANERTTAEGFKLELDRCAFGCTNSIKVSSDLPSVSDADVFCFITNFTNPNSFDCENIESDVQFDTLYLIIKIAHNLSGPLEEEKPDETTGKHGKLGEKNILPVKNVRKPIFIADGVVPLHILMALTKNLPPENFFCSTPLPAMAKSVLGEYLKVQCSVLNDVLVWAADDELFHVEFEKPLIIHDKVGDDNHCDWNMISKDLLSSINLDHTQFSASWLKKDLIEKMSTSARNNPYGCIYRASLFAKTVRDIWTSRSSEGTKVYTNMGVISDGSLETVKGYPYILPVVFTRETWSVNTRFGQDIHLKQIIKQINKAKKKYNGKLVPFCKKFLEDNVINQAFVVAEEESHSSIYSLVDDTSRPSCLTK